MIYRCHWSKSYSNKLYSLGNYFSSVKWEFVNLFVGVVLAQSWVLQSHNQKAECSVLLAVSLLVLLTLVHSLQLSAFRDCVAHGGGLVFGLSLSRSSPFYLRVQTFPPTWYLTKFKLSLSHSHGHHRVNRHERHSRIWSSDYLPKKWSFVAALQTCSQALASAQASMKHGQFKAQPCKKMYNVWHA